MVTLRKKLVLLLSARGILLLLSARGRYFYGPQEVGTVIVCKRLVLLLSARGLYCYCPQIVGTVTVRKKYIILIQETITRGIAVRKRSLTLIGNYMNKSVPS